MQKLYTHPCRGAHFMFRPSRPKDGMFWPCSTKIRHVSTRAQPKFGMFWPAWPIQMCLTVLEQSKKFFNRARPKKMCSTKFSYVSTSKQHKLSKLKRYYLCFCSKIVWWFLSEWINYLQFKCLEEMNFLSHFPHLLKYLFEYWVENAKKQSIFEKNFFWLRITARQPIFFDHAQLHSKYLSTVLEVCFYRARGMFRNCARPKPLSHLFFFVRAMTCARLWKSKHKVSTSTRARNCLQKEKILLTKLSLELDN